MKRRPAVIAYDVECHRTRRQVHRVLREWRLDGQKSVHECRLTAPEADELLIQLAEVIDRDRDRMLLAWLAGHRPALARGGNESTVWTSVRSLRSRARRSDRDRGASAEGGGGSHPGWAGPGEAARAY